MTIKEAIEILANSHKRHTQPLDQDGSDAIKLGIESLKRLEESRNLAQIASLKLLPGESLENTL